MSDEPTSESQVEVSITKMVDFYGDQIPAAQAADDQIYIPIRPLTSARRQAARRRVGVEEMGYIPR